MIIKKIQFFNMIEVLLALTVIAIGMSSVLGLFPVGLNASRDAIAENMSADVADQMVTYMRVRAEADATGVAYDRTFSDTLPYDLTCLPTFDSGTDHLDIRTSGDTTTMDLKGASEKDVYVDYFNVANPGMSDDFLTAYKTGDVGFGSTDSASFPRVAPGWSIFTKYTNIAGLRRRVYFIVQGPNCTEDGGNRNIDYSAMALVWKSPIQIQCLDSDGAGWSPWPSTADADAYKYSGQINIELSWPLELPYSKRKKRYYQIVISKP